MRRAWPLLLILLLTPIAATAMPADEWQAHTNSFPGLGALRDGGAVLFLHQGLINEPEGHLEVVKFAGKNVVLTTSKGVIY